MEGYSEGGGLGQGFIEGKEIVYDYATMTRARFTYTGRVGSPLLASAGWTLYIGNIIGFDYEPDNVQSTLIINNYGGASNGLYFGAGPSELPLTVGAGIFWSPSSSVKGMFTYFFAGIGAIPIDGVGFESYYDIDAQSLRGDKDGVEFYADASGHVNRGKMISDILTGDHSPIGVLSGYTLTSFTTERLGQVSAVLIAAAFFEDYHKQREAIKCAPHFYGPPKPLPNPFENPIPLPIVP